MDRDAILNIGMEMLAGGASLEDVVAAAANYGVNLYDVYYSDPGTTFEVTTPAPVDTTPPPQEPSYVDPGPVYEEPPPPPQLIYNGFTGSYYAPGDPYTPRNSDGSVKVEAPPAGGLSVVSPPASPVVTAQTPVEQPPVVTGGLSTVLPPTTVKEEPAGALEVLSSTPTATSTQAAASPLTNNQLLAIRQAQIDARTGDYLTPEQSAALAAKIESIAGRPISTQENIDAFFVYQNKPDVTPTAPPTAAQTITQAPLSAVTNTLDLSKEVKEAKDFWTKATGNPIGMTDKEIEQFIKDNPEDFNLKLFAAADQLQSAPTPATSGAGTTTGVTGADTITGAAGNDAVKPTAPPPQVIYNGVTGSYYAPGDPNTPRNADGTLDIVKGVMTLSGTGGNIAYKDIVNYADKNKLPYATVADALKTTFKDTTQEQILEAMTYEKSRQNIVTTLQGLQEDGALSLREILDVIKQNQIPIDEFVKKYLAGDEEQKTKTIAALIKESEFTPQEQQWRETASGLTGLTPQQVLAFQEETKLSDADMDRIFGIKPDDLDTYRSQERDTFIRSGLSELQANDNKLDYSEILSFAKQNNIPFTEMAKYIAEPEKQEAAVKTLQDVSATQALRESLIGTQVSDYQGNKYDATQLLNLADQIKQNFDLKSSSGGVYQTEGQSVGFNYDEASKLFPEGKAPKVIDQVALDMARNLLNQGITDIAEISKYKPTEVYESTPNQEGGGEIGSFTTKYIDPATGKEFSPYLGATYTGEGGTNYQVKLDASGAPVFSTTFEDTSDKQEVGMMLAFAAAIAAPQILPELIGSAGMTASAATQAAIAAGATTAAEIAAVSSALTAGTGVTGALIASGVSSSVAPYAASVLVNGTVQGLMAEAGGGSFEKGFITGGVAPVIGQLATNAVNTALGDLSLPSGVDKAVGNAVTQLIATGEIDPKQMLVAGVTPTISKTIQDATGLNAAQTKLLLNTIVSEGKNLEALLDPAKAIAFINANKGIFENIGGAATPVGGLAQSTGGAGTDTVTGGLSGAADTAGGGTAVDNVVRSGLSTSVNPAEDAQIAQQQRITAANQAIADYLGPGNDLSREGLVSQLQTLGFSAADSENYAKQADAQINQQRVGADVMNRYSRIDPEFGTPGLDRQTAVTEMVAAGFSEARANELLNGIDAQNAIKLENKLSVQSAYQNFLKGTGTEDQLRSALTSAGYNDTAINDLVTRGRGVIEGQSLTTGEQAQERAASLPDIRAEVAAKPTFNEAYALAREKLGPGATFTWQGKDYSTATAQERPDLSGATKPTTEAATTAGLGTPYVAPNGMHNRAAFIQAGGGTSDADYAKYVNAVNAVISQGQSGTLIKPSSVNSEGKDLPSTTGPVTVEKPRVDSVLGSVVAQGAANFGANSIAGPLSALGFTDAGAAVLTKATELANAATAAQGEDITRGKQEINAAINKVGESTNLKEAATSFGNLIYTAFKNPKAFGAEVGSEIVEEILQIGSLKGLGFWTREALGSAVENGGAAYNQEYANQIKQGIPVEEAHKNAQIAAGAASGASLAAMAGGALLSKGVNALTGSADDVIGGLLGKTKEVAKATTRESIQGGAEEGLIAAAVDKAVRGEINPANVLSGIAGGVLYEGPTSGTMQGGNLGALEETSTSIGSGIDLSQTMSSTINSGIKAGEDTSAVISSSVSSAIQSGDNPATIVSTAVDGGIKAGGDTAVVIDSSVSTALNNGGDAATVISSAVNSGITSGADASVVIGSAITSGIASETGESTVVEAAVTSGIASGADVSTVISTAVNSSIKAGGDASTIVASTVSAGITAGSNTGDVVTATVEAGIKSGGDTTKVVSSVVDSGIKAGGDTTVVVDNTIDAGIKAGGSTVEVVGGVVDAGITAGGDTTEVVSSAVTSGITAGGDTAEVVSATIESGIKAGGDTTVVVTSSVDASIKTGADAAEVVTTATETAITAGGDTTSSVSGAVSGATNAGASTETVVSSAIDGAIKAGGSSTEATSAAVSTTIIDALVTGGDTSSTITKAVEGSVSSSMDSGTALIISADSALSTGAAMGLDTGNVVTSVITGAVNGGTDSATAISSTVSVAISQGADVNTAIDAAQQTDTKATITIDNNGTVTTQTDATTSTVSIDTTTGITSTVTINNDTNSAVVTEVDTNNGVTTETKIDSNGNVTTDTTLHVVPPEDKTTLPTTPTGATTGITTGATTEATTGATTVIPAATTVTAPTATTTAPVTTPTAAQPARASSAGMMIPGMISGAKLANDWLGGKLLGSQTREKYLGPLAQYFAEVQDLPAARIAPETVEEEMRLPYYTYGQEPSFDQIFGEIPIGAPETDEEEPVYRAGGSVMNPQFMYAQGGLSRQDFRQGKHVSGPGDGQSDDIPAMLADGEFVFPSDVVSALGNGSTKAGTEKLYEMMHAIRQRARSKGPKDLPPPAFKSPLDYLKKR